MFDPKGNSLLDEQLAVAGLEMQWVGAVIGAATAIGSGIMGMSRASSANATAKKNYKKQKKFNKKVAKKQNEYNAKVDANQEANYKAMREFNQKTALSNWERGKEIQDYEYNSAIAQYNKSESIYEQTVGTEKLKGLNELEFEQATAAQAQALQDAFTQKQFALTDARFALQDELRSQQLQQSLVSAERRDIKTRSDLDRKDIRNKFKIAKQEQEFNQQTLESTYGQASAEAQLERQQQSANLQSTYKSAQFDERGQRAQMRSIQSRRDTGTQSINNTIEQLRSQGNYQKEAAMIEGLLAEGQASLGQAGKSTAKAIQSNRAQLQRGLASLASDLSGKNRQAAIQLAELQAELSLAETGVGINLEKISESVSEAERQTDRNLARLEVGMAGTTERFGIDAARGRAQMLSTTQDLQLQDKRVNNAQRLAMAKNTVQQFTINDAIGIANRDYADNVNIINLNYESAKAQNKLNIDRIGLEKKYADLNAKAAKMLKPEQLSYNPKPEEPPEHIFLKSQKAIPGYTPSPAMQNIYAPLVEGIGGAAGQLVGVDFTQNPWK